MTKRWYSLVKTEYQNDLAITFIRFPKILNNYLIFTDREASIDAA